MTDENKEVIVRWTAFIFGVLFILLLVQSVIALFPNNDKSWFIFTIFMPVLPLIVTLLLLGTIYCAILFVRPRKFPIFDSHKDVDDTPTDES